MGMKYFYSIISIIVLTAGYDLNSTHCVTSYCLYLYRSKNILSWDRSSEACRQNGLDLLWIQSSEMQNAVEELLKDLPRDEATLLWTAGRGCDFQSWTYLNGTKWIKKPTVQEQKAYCMRIKLCNGEAPEYIADNCDEVYGEQRLLCQSEPDKRTVACPSSFHRFADKCYNKWPYNGQKKIDWYTGQSYCSRSAINGQIAYSYIDDNASIERIRHFVDNSSDCVHLWLGVRTHPWYWHRRGTEDVLPMTYFYWDKEVNTVSSNTSCVCIRHKNQSRWTTEPCYDSTVKGFICIKYSHSRNGAGSKRDFNFVYLVPVVVGLALITLAVAVSYRRWTSVKDRHVYVNDNINQTRSHPPSCEQNQYAGVITADGSAVDGSSTSPYEEIDLDSSSGDWHQHQQPSHPKPKPKPDKVTVAVAGEPLRDPATPRHIVAPSGELYALSSKAKISETRAYRKGPAGDLYALPKKDVQPSAPS